MSEARAKYTARFSVPLEIVVNLHADDEDEAAERAWELANEYVQGLWGNGHVSADADLDGIGAYSVEIATPPPMTKALLEQRRSERA